MSATRSTTKTSVAPKASSTTASVPNLGAEPQIALHQRRQPAQRVLETVGRDRRRGDGAGARAWGDAPFRLGRALARQRRQRGGMGAGVRAGKARAAEHHVDAMGERIGPDAAPQGFERAPGAIALGDAGAAELHEVAARDGGRSARRPRTRPSCRSRNVDRRPPCAAGDRRRPHRPCANRRPGRDRRPRRTGRCRGGRGGSPRRARRRPPRRRHGISTPAPP